MVSWGPEQALKSQLRPHAFIMKRVIPKGWAGCSINWVQLPPSEAILAAVAAHAAVAPSMMNIVVRQLKESSA